MEGTASRCGGKLQIYLISFGRQPKRAGSQYLVLDEKKPECCTILLRDLDLNGFVGMIKAMENGTLYMETQQTELAKHKPEFVGVQ